MRISEALKLSQNQFKKAGIESFFLDSLLLLMRATSFSKERIVFNPDLELSEKQQKDFLALVQRRQGREPISHIINNREFYGLDFFVNQDVLDPRPYSEHLIELALEKFPNKSQEIEVLEIGVGSGCLTISLLKNLVNARATGLDISLKALDIARKNSITHQVENRFELIHSDLFENLSVAKKFDLIISNPPYIESKKIEELEDEVRLFEPRLALDGGVDGLDFYRKIANSAALFLKPKATIILEVGHGQKNDVEDIFIAAGFSPCEAISNEKRQLDFVVVAAVNQ